MGALSSNLLALIQPGRSDLLEVCEFDLPAGWLRAAPVSFSSMGRGHFQGRVRSYGPVSIVPSDRDGAIGTSETTIEMDDTDRVWARIAEGADAHSLVGSAVSRHLVHPQAAFADWHTTFSGILTKRPEYPSEFVVRLTARVDDAALEALAPRKDWTVDRVSWPNAHASAITKPAPLIYGTHSCSNYQAGPGFVPGIYVDTIGYRFAFAAGRLLSVDQVFGDGAQIASGWTASYAVDRRNRVWTIITFDDATHVEKVITANVTGYESSGDGSSGSLIEDPADQLAHLLSNWVFGEWKNGSAWLGTHARVGPSLTGGSDVVKTFLGPRAPCASVYYGTRTSGSAIVQSWCKSHGMLAYWAPDGTLEFAVEDVAVQPYTGQTLDWGRDVLGFETGHDDIAVSSAIRLQLVRSASEDQYKASIGVVDPEAEQDEPEELSLPWSPAS